MENHVISISLLQIWSSIFMVTPRDHQEKYFSSYIIYVDGFVKPPLILLKKY